LYIKLKYYNKLSLIYKEISPSLANNVGPIHMENMFKPLLEHGHV